jgi:hypothetical protein
MPMSSLKDVLESKITVARTIYVIGRQITDNSYFS